MKYTISDPIFLENNKLYFKVPAQIVTEHKVFTLSIGTPYLLTILVLKFEIVHSTTCMCLKYCRMYVKQ